MMAAGGALIIAGVVCKLSAGHYAASQPAIPAGQHAAIRAIRNRIEAVERAQAREQRGLIHVLSNLLSMGQEIIVHQLAGTVIPTVTHEIIKIGEPIAAPDTW